MSAALEALTALGLYDAAQPGFDTSGMFVCDARGNWRCRHRMVFWRAIQSWPRVRIVRYQLWQLLLGARAGARRRGAVGCADVINADVDADHQLASLLNTILRSVDKQRM
jgi:hypothetical protein